MCTVCTKCAHDTLCAHFVLEVYTLCTLFVEPKTLCANFFWAAGNFLHTFPGQDRTSCTLFKAVFRNLCVLRLALHPVHTVRPPTGCPVPPGAPSARPAWIKLCGLCYLFWHQGHGEAHGVRRPHARRPGRRRTMQPHPRPAPGGEAKELAQKSSESLSVL